MKSIIEKLINRAKGEKEADLLLKGGNLVNVFSGEIYQEDIAIYDEYIIGFGDYRAKEVIDVSGMYLAPGFIDGHVHIESSMVEVPQFARAVVPLGTTSVIADPHEIANVLGYDGIRYILESSKYNPLNVFIMLPSCVPSSHLETAGSTLRAFDLYPFLQNERWVLGLGEVMNYPGVLSCDQDTLDKLKISSDKRIDGHVGSGLTGKELNAYVVSGISSDHENTTVEDAREKLRKGMYIMIREGTGTKNLKDLLPLVNAENKRRCLFVTDDRHPHDLIEEGHMNFLIKTAIKEGLDPVSAIQMATINTADYFNLQKLGAITPGRYADLVVIDNFENFNIKKVFQRGKLVAVDQQAVYDLTEMPKAKIRSSVNIKWLEGNEFKIPATTNKCRIIEIVPDQIVTNEVIEEVKVLDGFVISAPERDVIKIAVVERHSASGNIGVALVKGFGLKSGAIACSIAHDSHNIVVVGVNDVDINRAVVQINKMGGGLAIANNGEIIDYCQLPIAGLMSDKPVEEVYLKLKEMIKVTHQLGCKLKDPFMTLSFLALPVIPRLKLTDLGLVDVHKFDFVDLFV